MDKLRQITKWGLYLFVFLLPLQARYIFSLGFLNEAPWEYGTFSLYLTEVLLVILLILGIITHLIDFDEDLHYRGRRALNIYITLTIFLLVALGSVYFARDLKIAVLGFLRLFEGVALTFLLIHSRFSLHRLAQVFVASAIVQSFLAIAQFFMQKISAATWLGVSQKLPEVLGVSVVETSAGRFLRAYGTLGHPNILAGFLVVALLFVFILLFTHTSKKEKLLLHLSTIIIFLGLFFTFSRLAFVVLFLALLIIGIYLLINKNRGLLLIFGQNLSLIIIVGLIFSALNFDIIKGRFFNPDIFKTPSVSQRVDYFQMSRQLVADNWLRGVGLRNYTLALFQAYPNLSGYDYQPVHNVYILILVEMGLGGLFVFLYFLYEIAKNIFNFKLEYSQELLKELERFQMADVYEKDYAYTTHWYIGLSGIIVGFLFWFFFEHYFWTLYPGIILWWFLVGLWLRVMIRMKR